MNEADEVRREFTYRKHRFEWDSENRWFLFRSLPSAAHAYTMFIIPDGLAWRARLSAGGVDLESRPMAEPSLAFDELFEKGKGFISKFDSARQKAFDQKAFG